MLKKQTSCRNGNAQRDCIFEQLMHDFFIVYYCACSWVWNPNWMSSSCICDRGHVNKSMHLATQLHNIIKTDVVYSLPPIVTMWSQDIPDTSSHSGKVIWSRGLCRSARHRSHGGRLQKTFRAGQILFKACKYGGCKIIGIYTLKQTWSKGFFHSHTLVTMQAHCKSLVWPISCLRRDLWPTPQPSMINEK